MTLSWDKMSDEQKIELREQNRSEYIRLYKAHYGFAPNFTNSLK